MKHPKKNILKQDSIFFKFSSAETIYYGNYITAEYDRPLFGEVAYDVPTYNPSSPQPSAPEPPKTPPAKKQRKSTASKSVAKKKKETKT